VTHHAPDTLRRVLAQAHYQAGRQHELGAQLACQLAEYHDGAPLEAPAATFRAAGQLHGLLERLNSWAAQLHTEMDRETWRRK